MQKQASGSSIPTGSRQLNRTLLSWLVIASLPLVGCGPAASTKPQPDTARPAAVEDLTARFLTTTSLTLTWTAVGDDSLVGTASHYDIRYSVNQMIAWDQMTPVSDPPTPKAAGQAETLTVGGLQANAQYYFRLKVADEVRNWSSVSNQAHGWTAWPQDSPTNCLVILKSAYVNRELDPYKSLFANDFLFGFSMVDIADPNDPTPPKWGSADEETSADKLFHSELVDSIRVTFVQDSAVDSGTEYAGTWKVHLTQVNLLVYTRLEGQPWIYRVNNGTANFYFKEYPNEQASSGQPLWRIWQWVDEPASAGSLARVSPMAQYLTWGRIKNTYAEESSG